MTVQTKGYSVEQVIEVVEMLAQSQGFYGRLLRDIREMQAHDEDKFEEFKELIELMGFENPVDVVMFFEG